MLTKKRHRDELETQLGPVAPWDLQRDRKGSEVFILEVSVIIGFPVTATQEKSRWVDGGAANKMPLASFSGAACPLGSECGRCGEVEVTTFTGPHSRPDFGPKLSRIS